MSTLAYGGNMVLWIAIAVIILLLFGGQKIPEIMRGLGIGMKEFKKGLSEPEDNLRRHEPEERELTDKEREREIRARVEAEMHRERENKEAS